jgi:hypothetical protein
VQTAFPNTGTTIVTRATNSTTQVTTKEMSTHLQNVSSLIQCRPPAPSSDYEPINYELNKKFKSVKNTEKTRPRSISRQSRMEESDYGSRTPYRPRSISRLSRLEDLDLRSITPTRKFPEANSKSKKDEAAEAKKKSAFAKQETKKKEDNTKAQKKVACKTEPVHMRTPVYSSMASIASNPNKSVIQYLFGCFKFKVTTYSKDKNTK